MRLGLSERARDDLARIWDFNLERSERWAEKCSCGCLSGLWGFCRAAFRTADYKSRNTATVGA